MYPNDVIFGMGLYEICVMTAMLVGLFLADRMATKSGFPLPCSVTLSSLSLRQLSSVFSARFSFKPYTTGLPRVSFLGNRV